jgi:hypothetical protein
MSSLNFKFQAKNGNAIVSKSDIICIEDVDDYSCAISVRMPNNEVHKIFSIERAEDLYERVMNVKSIAPNFVERRQTLDRSSENVS